MARNVKQSRTAPFAGLGPFLKRQAVVWAVYLAVFFSVAAIAFAAGLSKRDLPVVGVAAFAAAAVCCGFFAGRRSRKNGLLTGFLTCLPPQAALLLASLAVNGFLADWTALLDFLILSLCSMLGGVAGVNMVPSAAKRRGKGRRV